MPEQRLDAAQIGAAIEHMRRETVTQGVRADSRIQPGLHEVLADHLVGVVLLRRGGMSAQEEHRAPRRSDPVGQVQIRRDEGPRLARSLVTGLRRRLELGGFRELRAAVGSGAGN